MAAVVPDPRKIKSFRTADEFYAWLSKNHARESELWLKIHKKDSGKPSVSNSDAVDVALCWGWIDGIRKGFDEHSFLQRFTPRKPKSIWSQINRDRIARLTRDGRMTAHGQRQVELAKADGRWDAAYAPMRTASQESLPADLRAAIRADARAQKTLETLGRTNLFALAFRTNNMKTAEGRKKKIAALVALLASGKGIVPERPARKTPTQSARATADALKRAPRPATRATPRPKPRRPR